MQALIIICKQTRTYAHKNHAHAILFKRSVTWPHDHSDSIRISFSPNNQNSKWWRFYSALSKEPINYARKKLGPGIIISSTAN